MQKRWVAGLLVSVLLLVSFSASATVTITHFTNIHHGVAYHEWLQRQADKFNASRSDVQVELIKGNAENLNTMILAGVSPDISDIHLYINPIGFRVNVRPLMERDGILDLLHPSLITYAEAADRGIYQIPLEVAAQPTFFNRDLFDEAGLPAPDELQEDWTWDEVIASGMKLTVDKDGDGVPEIFAVDRPWGNWRTAVAQAGGSFYDFDEQGKPIRSLWNTPEVEAGMEFINRIYRARITPSLLVPNERDYDLYSGRSAFTLTEGMWAIGNLADVNFNYDIYLQPSGPDGPRASVGISGPQLLHDQNLEAAWEWVKFYVFSEESQREFVLATGRLPSLKSVQEEYFALMNIEHLNYRYILEQSTIGPPGKNYGLPDELHPRNVNVWSIWQGTISVRSFLENIHNVMTARLNAL